MYIYIIYIYSFVVNYTNIQTLATIYIIIRLCVSVTTTDDYGD